MSERIDEYIKRSLAGDKDAFAQLFNEYRCSVKNLLVSLSGSEFDSNDLLQESFIKAFLNLDKYNSKYPFKYWLLSIARNTFIDSVRRRSVQSYKSMLSCDDLHDIIDEEIHTIEYDVRELVAQHIEDLPPKSRKIVELRYYVGHDYATIAREMDIPEGTVKSILHRAKSRLKEEITKYLKSEISE